MVVVERRSGKSLGDNQGNRPVDYPGRDFPCTTQRRRHRRKRFGGLYRKTFCSSCFSHESSGIVSSRAEFTLNLKPIKRTWLLPILLLSLLLIEPTYTSEADAIPRIETNILDARQTHLSALGREFSEELVSSSTIREFLKNRAIKQGIDADVLLRVIERESRFDPEAIGDGGHSVGIWQIHLPNHPTITEECAKDVHCSTDYAMPLFKKCPWLWTAWRNLFLS